MKATRQDAMKLMHDGADALAAVEAAGLRIDVPYLEGQKEKITKRIESLTEKMRNDKVFKIWRKQFGALTAQAAEVRALSTKVTADAAEPIKSQMARGVEGRAH